MKTVSHIKKDPTHPSRKLYYIGGHWHTLAQLRKAFPHLGASTLYWRLNKGLPLDRPVIGNGKDTLPVIIDGRRMPRPHVSTYLQREGIRLKRCALAGMMRLHPDATAQQIVDYWRYRYLVARTPPRLTFRQWLTHIDPIAQALHTAIA